MHATVYAGTSLLEPLGFCEAPPLFLSYWGYFLMKALFSFSHGWLNVLILFVMQYTFLDCWHCKEIDFYVVMWFYSLHYYDKVEYLLQDTAQFPSVSNENVWASLSGIILFLSVAPEMTHPAPRQHSTLAAISPPGLSTH